MKVWLLTWRHWFITLGHKIEFILQVLFTLDFIVKWEIFFIVDCWVTGSFKITWGRHQRRKSWWPETGLKRNCTMFTTFFQRICRCRYVLLLLFFVYKNMNSINSFEVDNIWILWSIYHLKMSRKISIIY